MNKRLEIDRNFRVSVLVLAVIVTSLMRLTAGAQEKVEFGVFPHSAPDGILLIVGGPILHPNVAAANSGWVGYHLYRKGENDTGFVRITAAPLSRAGSLAELETILGGDITGLERFAGLTSKEEFWQRIEQNDSSVLALTFMSKHLRRALGLLFLDAKVQQGRTYQYRATLVAADGHESEPSEPLSATCGVPPIPLLGPLDVQAKSTEQGVELSWTMNPADSGAFTYSVYRSPDLDGSYLRLNLAPLTYVSDSATADTKGTFVDTTAQTGRIYFYAVVSTDYAGNESPHDSPVSFELADILPPRIPQNVFANPSDLGITVTWDTISGDNVAGYNIYRSTDPDSFFVKLNEVLLPFDAGYYEDKSTSLVDRYFYRVTAVDRSGNESERSARSLSLFENYLPPAPPQGVRAEARSGGVFLQWDRSDEADVRGYYVFRANSYNSELSQISPLIGRDTTEFTDSSAYLSARGQYWYLVQAINYTGVVSSYSEPVAASPDNADTTDAPRSFFGYHDAVGVRLLWTLPDDNAIAGYRVYRATEADSLVWTPLTEKPLDREVAEYVDTSITVGEVYHYLLHSVNDRGEESEPSHDLRIVTFEEESLPPGGVRVVSEGGALKVYWQMTHQSNVAGYRVYRHAESEPPAALTKDVVPIATSEYRDASVQRKVRYYYSVSCVDQTGREGKRSVEVSYFVD